MMMKISLDMILSKTVLPIVLCMYILGCSVTGGVYGCFHRKKFSDKHNQDVVSRLVSESSKLDSHIPLVQLRGKNNFCLLTSL